MIWIVFFLFFAVVLYYGYHLVVKRGSDETNGGAAVAACHLCRQKFRVHDMVARDKDAGFINYFCGACIERLSADYLEIRQTTQFPQGTAPLS